MAHEKTYRCTASGHGTFKAKDELKSWGFGWDKDRKVWTVACVEEDLKQLFESNVTDGTWKQVVLEFTEEVRESWEDEIDNAPDASAL